MGLGAAQAGKTDTRLPQAAKNGDKVAVSALLRQKINVDAALPDGTTALHWAAYRNDAETVNLLLAARANPNVSTDTGITPLMLACPAAEVGIIESLLKAGASVRAASPEGETPLMTASRAGRTEVIKALLAHGADVNAIERWRGQTALMWAAAEGHAEAAKLLLDHGADINAVSGKASDAGATSYANNPIGVGEGGWTALMLAARGGHADAIGVLLVHGADINSTIQGGLTAVAVAIVNAHYDTALFLIEEGANPNANGPQGQPLHLLVNSRNPEIQFARPVATGDGLALAKAILARGGQVDARQAIAAAGRGRRGGGAVPIPVAAAGTGTDGQIAVNLAAARAGAPGGGSRPAEGRAATAAAPPAAPPAAAPANTTAGPTALWMAARAADLPLLKLLLASGADPKATTPDGKTALMMAAGVGYHPGQSPGSESDALEAVKLICEQACDVAAADVNGDTALHGGALRGSAPILQFLLSKGAPVNPRNRNGYTPLDLAIFGYRGESGAGTMPPALVTRMRAVLEPAGGTTKAKLGPLVSPGSPQ
jgi:ankyrin repeat protein